MTTNNKALAERFQQYAQMDRAITFEPEMVRRVAAALTATPSAQGDASPEGSGGGEWPKGWAIRFSDLYAKHFCIEGPGSSTLIGPENNLHALFVALSTPQAQPDDGHYAKEEADWRAMAEIDNSPEYAVYHQRVRKPAPTVDSRAALPVARVQRGPGPHSELYAMLLPAAKATPTVKEGDLLYHPAPAPDVALRHVYSRLMAINADSDGDNYLKLSAEALTLLRPLVEPFTAAQPKEKK